MAHPIQFPKEFKDGLSQFLDEALQRVKFRRYGNEPNYTPAFIQQLDGLKYEGARWRVTVEGAVMTSVSQYSAEWWSGADCAVVTTISEIGKPDIRKASLLQAKRGLVETLKSSEHHRLVEQIKDMRALTKHPKVLEIFEETGAVPTVVSATGILNGRRLQHQSFGRWVSTRILPTFDGDTKPHFIDAVLDAELNNLRIYAREKP
jgi:hypothetical protein